MIKNTSTAGEFTPSYMKYVPATAETGMTNEIPVESKGAVHSSWKYGFGRILTASNVYGNDREDFVKTLRAIACNLSEFDTDIVKGRLITFDQEFCDAIGGYPKDACLWHEKNGRLSLLRSTIPDNTYNFNEDESHIGKYWVYTTARNLKSGFPNTKPRSAIRPFGTISKSAITAKNNYEPKRISNIYIAERDFELVCNATIEWSYDCVTPIPQAREFYKSDGDFFCMRKYNDSSKKWDAWKDVENLSGSTHDSASSSTSNNGYLDFKGTIDGTIPCGQMQYYLVVSDIGEDYLKAKNLYIGSPHDAFDSSYINNVSSENTGKDGFGYPYNFLYNSTPQIVSENSSFAPSDDEEFLDGARLENRNHSAQSGLYGEVSYYPIFNTDLSPRTLTIPVRFGQSIYVVESPRNGYAVRGLSISVTLFPVGEYKL